jgi:pimeloyl-ACP methyl ester carboxylesterase
VRRAGGALALAMAMALAACASQTVARAPSGTGPGTEPPPPPPEPEPVVERARVSGGVELAWQRLGDPRGRPLLLIMGLGMQLIGWDDELCAMLAARGFQVIRFDNRDVGRSTRFDDAGDPNVLQAADEIQKRRPLRPAYRLADMADDAAGLMEAAGWPAAHVVGLSMGGMIAQELALRHPARVLSLTSIMSTTGDPSLRGPSYEVSAALLVPFRADRAGFVARAVRLARTLHGTAGIFPLDENRVRRLAARSCDRGPSPAGTRRQLVAIWASGSRRARLGAVRVPTLVVHGEADPLIPVEGGEDTARAIPGARLERIAGMGHDLPREVWPRLVDAIAANAARADAANAP